MMVTYFARRQTVYLWIVLPFNFQTSFLGKALCVVDIPHGIKGLEISKLYAQPTCCPSSSPMTHWPTYEKFQQSLISLPPYMSLYSAAFWSRTHIPKKIVVPYRLLLANCPCNRQTWLRIRIRNLRHSQSESLSRPIKRQQQSHTDAVETSATPVKALQKINVAGLFNYLCILVDIRKETEFMKRKPLQSGSFVGTIMIPIFLLN